MSSHGETNDLCRTYARLAVILEVYPLRQPCTEAVITGELNKKTLQYLLN